MMDDRSSLALLTDLYQLTMAAGYHRAGIAERQHAHTDGPHHIKAAAVVGGAERVTAQL